MSTVIATKDGSSPGKDTPGRIPVVGPPTPLTNAELSHPALPAKKMVAQRRVCRVELKTGISVVHGRMFDCGLTLNITSMRFARGVARAVQPRRPFLAPVTKRSLGSVSHLISPLRRTC